MSRKSPLADNRIRDRFNDTIPATTSLVFLFPFVQLSSFLHCDTYTCDTIFHHSLLPISLLYIAIAAAFPAVRIFSTRRHLVDGA